MVLKLGPTKVTKEAIDTYVSSAAYFMDVLLAFKEEMQDRNCDNNQSRSCRIDYHFALAPYYAFTKDAQAETMVKINRSWKQFRNFKDYGPVIDRKSNVFVRLL